MRYFLFLGFLVLSNQVFAADKLLPGFPIYGQPDSISCGPTSASMVLKYYGFTAGIGPLKTQAKTQWFSFNNFKVGMTHPNDLSDAISHYSLGNTIYSAKTQDLKTFIDQGRPSLVLLRSGRSTWHYVVVIGYLNDGSVFTIADPGNGGYTHNMTAAQLSGAWRFSHDMSGNYIPDPSCGNCHGSGHIWTKCPTCGGSGKIKGPFGSWTKCVFCSGEGKWSANCPLCSGKGTLTDGFRKVVESAGAKGNTAIVPTKSSPNVPGKRFGMICLWNKTQISVKYSYQWGTGEWKKETVEAGKWRSHNWNYPFINDHHSPNFNISFDSALTPGANVSKKYALKRTASEHKDCSRINTRDSFNYVGNEKKELELYHTND